MSYQTTFLTPGAFLDRFAHTPDGGTFSYAKGDLAVACQYERDAVKLRDLTQKLVEEKQIALTQQPIAGTTMRGGGRAFEYLATKRAPKKAGEDQRHAK